jgi:hypothetical protein
VTRTQPQPTSLSEVLERIDADLVIADAQLRFSQGRFDELKQERDAVLRAIERYAPLTPAERAEQYLRVGRERQAGLDHDRITAARARIDEAADKEPDHHA